MVLVIGLMPWAIMIPEWRHELLRLFGGLVLAGIFGFMLGHVAVALAMTLALILFFHLRQLNRLLRWLNGDLSDAPEASGLWGRLFAGLVVDRRRNKENRDRLSTIISRFHKVTQALPDGVVVLGNNNEIEAINKAATHLLGIRLPQDSGQNIVNFLRDPEITRFFDDEEPGAVLTIRSPINRHIRISIRQVLIDKADFGRKLVIARDITRLHQLERVRQDFIANVSHELRTPLTVVAGYVELLLSNSATLDEALQKPLTRISQQSDRLSNIVDDLLKLSTLESSEPPAFSEKVDMPDLIDGCISQARELSRGQHEFSVEVDAMLGLRGNSHELESVLSNLLSNAVRYTPQQGKISVIWRRQEAAVMLQVEDSGIGIPTEHLSRLTQRFYRVDPGRSRDTGGTGLGLAIVKHILDRHTARLQIHSQADQGSRFRCLFREELAVNLESTTEVDSK